MEQNRPTEFWFEAEQLTKKALESKSTDFCKKVRSVLVALIESAAIADTTVAISMICIAKIEWFLGNRAEAKKLLADAGAKNDAFMNSWKAVDPKIGEILRFSPD